MTMNYEAVWVKYFPDPIDAYDEFEIEQQAAGGYLWFASCSNGEQIYYPQSVN